MQETEKKTCLKEDHGSKTIISKLLISLVIEMVSPSSNEKEATNL